MSDPKGVVAILVGSNGYVWATACDFSGDRPGGFRLTEAQEKRATRAVNIAFIRDVCSPILLQGLETFDVDQIVQRLCRKQVLKLVIRHIGEEEE